MLEQRNTQLEDVNPFYRKRIEEAERQWQKMQDENFPGTTVESRRAESNKAMDELAAKIKNGEIPNLRPPAPEKVDISHLVSTGNKSTTNGKKPRSKKK